MAAETKDDVSPVVEKLRDEIRRSGPLSFARFMEVALYDPEDGYYASGQERIGAEGDYYTAPHAHPLFGTLIGRQLYQMWQRLGQPESFPVVEVGGGRGLLARDVLRGCEELGSRFAGTVSYTLLERAGASERWEDLLSQGLKVETWEPRRALPTTIEAGCLLSNELFDSLPVHRVKMEGGHLREIYVGLSDGAFTDVVDEPSTPELASYFDRVGVRLEEGAEAEVSLERGEVMRRLAESLKKGFIITIDYGHPAHQLYSPERRRGTLMCYYQHAPNEEPYQRVGRQDITAHVDFTTLAAIGEEAGLRTEGFTRQRLFLLNLGAWHYVERLSRMDLPRPEYLANRMAMLELLKEDGLGGFGVLMQSRGVDFVRLYGLTKLNPLELDIREIAGSDELHVPLLRPEHIPLMKAKYPQQYWEFLEPATIPDVWEAESSAPFFVDF